MAEGDWTDAENDVVVSAYLALLESELRGQSMVKAEVNREVQRATGRGRGSVEFKFQNVSAVMRELRMPWVRGYKPAVNFQSSLSDAVLRQVPAQTSLLESAIESMDRVFEAQPTTIEWNAVAAPVVEFSKFADRHRKAVRVDFVKMDAENRSLGLAGEIAVVERERSLLRLAGKDDLARQVEHVSQTQGDGLGFDIRSFDLGGRERYLEVKSTRRGADWPMMVAPNEVRFSADEPAKFELHRVFDLTPSRAGLYVLRGAIEQTCDLRPASYEALPAQLAVS